MDLRDSAIREIIKILVNSPEGLIENRVWEALPPATCGKGGFYRRREWLESKGITYREKRGVRRRLVQLNSEKLAEEARRERVKLDAGEQSTWAISYPGTSTKSNLPEQSEVSLLAPTKMFPSFGEVGEVQQILSRFLDNMGRLVKVLSAEDEGFSLNISYSPAQTIRPFQERLRIKKGRIRRVKYLFMPSRGKEPQQPWKASRDESEEGP